MRFQFLILFAIAVAGENDGNPFKDARLIFSSVLFRHGDRTPESVYPTDPHRDKVWKEGMGQLTPRGKLMEYELGTWLRSHYGSLTNDTYNLHDKEITVISSDYDRTLMSAQLVMSGFYPPKSKEDVWNSQLQWQPIPVHTVPKVWDNMIAMGRPCTAYEKERRMLDNLPEMKALYEENKNLFEIVATKAGIKFSQGIADKVEELERVYDTLFIENLYNLSLPKWTTEIFPEPLRKVAKQVFIHYTYTHVLKRLAAGPLLQLILDDMRYAIKSKGDSPKKMRFYSGHDTTLSSVMHTLGIYNDIAPPYSSCLMIDLYLKGNEPLLTFSFRNSSAEPPVSMTIPECGEICEFDKFAAFVKPFIPENWGKECKKARDKSQQSAMEGGVVKNKTKKHKSHDHIS